MTTTTSSESEIQTNDIMSGSKKRVAIVAVHGMGQQIPFATQDKVASRLLEVNGQDASAARVSAVKVGEEVDERVEIELKVQPIGPHGPSENVEVHVYEAYWAPLTQGVIGLWDTLFFLYAGAFNGITRCRETFWRYIFGGRREFVKNIEAEEGKEYPRLYLLLVAAVVTSMVFIFGFSTLFMWTSFLRWVLNLSSNDRWPGEGVLHTMTITALVYTVTTAVLGLFLFLSMRLRTWFPKVLDSIWWKRMQGVLHGYFIVWLVLCVVLCVIQLCSVVWGSLFPIEGFSEWMSWRGQATLWLSLFLVSLKLRSIVVQYFGDVAIYITSHRLDRFHQARKKIKKNASDLLTRVYEQPLRNDEAFMYDQVILVAHSLGTVIAYDALNHVITNDTFREGKKLRPEDRTPLLLTFGSPLDKIAYLFRYQDQKTTLTREKLAGLKQPLISDEAYRRNLNWINVYSQRDPVSGSLEFYDHKPSNENLVVNKPDEHALIPLAAHVEYWENPFIWKQVLLHIR